MYDADFKQLLRDIGRHCTPEIYKTLIAEAAERDVPYPRRYVYDRYIRGDHWRAFRKQAIEAADDRCQRCGEPQHDDPEPFEVHHKHYDTVGQESLEDVIVTCVPCHAALDPQRKKWVPRDIRGAIPDDLFAD